MKIPNNVGQTGQLTGDGQKRLVAYTTAAGLGALFTSYSVDGQVTASAAFAPYPAVLPASSGTNAVDFPFDIDGDGTNDFQVVIFGEGLVPAHSQVADIIGLTNSVGTTNTVISDSKTSYLHAWMGGETISGTTGIAPSYKPRLAIAYGNGTYLNNKFPETAAVGFSFVSGLDGQTHFGYMNLRVIGSTNNLGQKMITSVVVKDVYYNATANAGITVPESVVVTNITLAAGNQVTIDFTSNTNTPPASFILETSPVLGPSANWTPDMGAVITQSLIANPNGAKPLAHYQAVTTGNGAPSQFFRITH